MLKMYGFWRSAAAFRVRMALNLKGIAFEEEMIDLDANGQHTGAYLSVNPQAVLPSLVLEDGTILSQSLSVIEYLDELHPTPPLLPADPLGRQRVRAIALVYAADHHPLIVPRVRRYLTHDLGLSEAVRDQWLTHWFRQGLELGEKKLAADGKSGEFCHGDALSLADLCLMSHAMASRGYKLDWSHLPNTARIVANCLKYDQIARAVPLRQPGAPASH